MNETEYRDIECNEDKVQLITNPVLESLHSTTASPQILQPTTKKRRSKNDEECKFECNQCNRTYSSKPALYTHIKTKHEVIVKAAPSRSRGRPKKVKPINADPSTFEYFLGAEKEGETLDSAVKLEEALMELKDDLLKNDIKQYPLLLKLERQVEDTKTCDDIFIKYLIQVSKVTNSQYFKILCKFIILLRECLNKYGWLKLFENIAPKIEEQEEAKTGRLTHQIMLTGEQVLMMDEEYSVKNNAEFALDISNEFIILFLPEYSSFGVGIEEGTNLLINFAEWLFENGYTCTKITAIKKHTQ